MSCIYMIPKGKRRGRPFHLGIRAIQTGFCKEREIHIKARFWRNCRYFIDGEDMYDINKLCGFTMGFTHQNSFRIGWRYSSKLDRIELFYYAWVNGKRMPFEPLCTVRFCEEVNLSIELFHSKKDDCYSVEVTKDGRDIIIPILYTKKEFPVKKYLSYPLCTYFGGNKKAPNDMNIDLEYMLH